MSTNTIHGAPIRQGYVSCTEEEGGVEVITLAHAIEKYPALNISIRTCKIPRNTLGIVIECPVEQLDTRYTWMPLIQNNKVLMKG
jgi:hypothetical protein